MSSRNKRDFFGCGSRFWIRTIAVLTVLFASRVFAAPGDVLFEDNLNGNLNNWTVDDSGGGDAQIDNKTSEQGRSLELRWDEVSVASDPFDAAVPAARLDVWIQRGSDSFSEDPDDGEDLVIEYLDNAGTWVELQRYGGNDDSPGDIYTPSIVLPSDALHAALQIRFRHTGGNGFDWDYWHVDNPTITEIEPAAPFGLGSCQDFEGGLGDWTVASNGGDAGVSNATANSGNNSLFTRWEEVTVTSGQIDLTGAVGVELSAWVRRGDDSFSENPDNNENLLIEYFDDSGSWVVLETFPGNGSQGEIFTPVYNLGTAALHSNFQIRVQQTQGSGNDWDYWHVDDVCLTGTQKIHYQFEETSWTGAADEVADSGSYGLPGTVFGGGNNAGSSPAISGDPGTCRYADFDGVDDYIEVADNTALDLETEVTVGVWVNARSIPSSDLHSIVSKDWNYEFHIDSSGRIFWYWNNSGGTTRTLTSSSSVTVGQWHHVAISYESGSQVIYLDGSPVATSSFSETLRLNDLPLYIGLDYNFLSRAWDGFIDEVNIFNQALSQAEVQALMAETHPCPNVAPQFSINHDGYGINCLAETITVDVVDSSSGNPVTDYNATVVLDTQSGNGTWQLVTGSGTLTDATANDGLATYDWALTESQAVFSLSYPEGVASIDVDVYQQNDTGIRDTDSEGTLEFSPNGFTITAAALSNPPPAVINTFAATQTAGTDFSLEIAAYGQTPNDAQCGIIEAYTGTKPLEFWMSHLNPGTGSIVATVDGVAISDNEPGTSVTNVDFTNGQATVIARYKDAGQIQISVKDESPADPDLASGIRGATSGFVVKPAEFRLSNIVDGGGNANPGSASAAGADFVAAGEAFSITVTAYDSQGDVTPNFGQENTAEGVQLSPGLVLPAGGNNPAIAGSFGAFSAGSASGNAFSWPEVGIINLTPSVADGDYLGGGNVTGLTSGNVGRFTAHHFDTSQNTPVFGTACSAGSFTYIGEEFGYTTQPVITFTAKALAGETTLNYEGDFFKMSGLADPVYSSTPATLDTSGLVSNGAANVASSGSGVGTLTYSSGSGLLYTKGAEEAVFNADISLAQTVVDSDGAAAGSNPVTFSSILFDSGAAMRWGRARLFNAYGSELVDLAMTLRSEYYLDDTSGFIINTGDSCSVPVSISFGGFTDNLGAGETCVLDSGTPGSSGAGCSAAAPPALQFSAPPSAGNFNLNLQAPGDGNDGSASVSADVPDWLEYDWDESTPGLEDPVGNATFGIFDGQDRRIYTRELY